MAPSAASLGTRDRRCSPWRRARRSRRGTSPRVWSSRVPATANGRICRIAASLSACAWRMHSSSSRGLAQLRRREHRRRIDRRAGRERLPQREGRVVERERSAREHGRELGRSLARLDLDRRMDELGGILRRNAFDEVGVEVRPRFVGAQAPRRSATTGRGRGRRPGPRAPVAYDTFCCPQSSNTSTSACAIVLCSRAMRSRRMRARSSMQKGSVTRATLVAAAPVIALGAPTPGETPRPER